MNTRTESLFDIIRLVRPLYKVLQASVALELERAGISVLQRTILEQLLDNDPQTVPEIGRRLILPRQFIQKNANILRQSGLIERHDNAAHRRSVLLALTGAGDAMIRQIRDREAEVMRPIAETMDLRHLKTTKSVIADMIAAFEAHNRDSMEKGVLS